MLEADGSMGGVDASHADEEAAEADCQPCRGTLVKANDINDVAEMDSLYWLSSQFEASVGEYFEEML